MVIKNFKMDGMLDIAERFMDTRYVSRREISGILGMTNISFVAIGINRAVSTLLCELDDSYVQQSQRYCDVGSGGYSIPNVFSSKDRERAVNLIEKSFCLYKEMTELVNDVPKPKKEDFKYGIPYEDGRYILPLACLTNISVSMSGDKLLELFRLCKRMPILFKDFYDKLKQCIDNRIIVKLSSCIEMEESGMFSSETYFHRFFNDIPDGGILRIYAGDDIKNAAIGALTSTSSGDPVDIYESWGADADSKADGIVNRVAFDYGHMGILEQCRNTYGFACSLSAYHQVIRHRIATLHRESIERLVAKDYVSFYVPPTIRGSVFEERYSQLVSEYADFIRSINMSYPAEVLFTFMLNCNIIKFISSSNARNDMYIFRERLCMRAQEEIRKMYELKYNDLVSVAPSIYSKAVPPCVYGNCKEGKMTCGKSNEMKSKYIRGDEN